MGKHTVFQMSLPFYQNPKSNKRKRAMGIFNMNMFICFVHQFDNFWIIQRGSVAAWQEVTCL